jgi:CRISPR/Cas system CMR subunit Cmr4 (Cas7 group RAMP superfamily)
VGITCKVSDDKGQTATATANLTILPPYVKPIPHTRALCSISFDNDKKRPTRVDNEAKACLDEVTLALKNDPAATAVVVGEASAKEKAATAKQQKAALKNKHVVVTDAAAERAVNTKDYLVTETQSGIDKTRISTQTGTADAQAVENYLVPSEATFASDVQGTTPVNESAVKVQVRKPLAMRHAHKAAAGKKAAHKKAAHKKAAAKKKAAGK